MEKTRIKKLQEHIRERDIDLIIIFSINDVPDKNMYYFTGYDGIGVFCVLKKNFFLVAPEMEYEKAKKICLKNKIKVFKSEKKIFDTIKNLLRNHKIKKISIDMNNCPILLYKKLRKAFKARFFDASDIFYDIRKIKNRLEIKYIKKACSVCDFIFSEICRNFNFKTEMELKKFIENKIMEKECEIAFRPIVASSKNTSFPHYSAFNSKIKKGFLMLDFGAKYKGYCSDMTRMIYIGKPSKKEIENYNLVLKTINMCEEYSEKEKRFSFVYEKSLKILGSKSKYFTHGLGHGLGLEIHEKPSIIKEDKNKIENNIVFTIEPGIYFPDKYGIRIEDTLVKQKNKIIVLTKSRKDLVIIEDKKIEKYKIINQEIK